MKQENVDFTANLGDDAVNTSINYVYVENGDVFGPGTNNYNSDYWTNGWEYGNIKTYRTDYIHINKSTGFPDNFLNTIKLPECYITTNKNRVKLFDSRSELNVKQLFLKDKEEFEIELFNPTTINYGVKIKLKGEYISNSHLIIKAGQRIILDRYIDTNNKFVFNTYTVENNNDVKEAIKNNGDIVIEYYPEINNYKPIAKTYDQFPILGSNGMHFYSSYQSDIIGNCSLDSLDCSFNDSFETGQVGKGTKSETEFTYEQMDFSILMSKQFIFKILPLSQKPIEPKDLIVYCTNCSKKTKKEWKFCSSCGTKI